MSVTDSELHAYEPPRSTSRSAADELVHADPVSGFPVIRVGGVVTSDDVAMALDDV
jgi:hypothetical protein